MIHLLYISSATSWPSETDLIKLLEQSRERNRRQNITGMLLYNNATYMQVLEGDSKDVHEIYDAICRDERNTGNVKLFEHEIIRRDFPDWSMGFRNLDTCSPDELPGFIDIFNGKLDKQIAINNKMAVVDLMVGFAKKYK